MGSAGPAVHPNAPPPGPPSISCRSVCSGYLGTEVLRDVSFEISAPSVYVVLGPNGAGKTTLFRTLAGILSPSRGEVRIGGVPGVHQTARDRMHYLSHLDGLPEGFTVREALAFYARAERADDGDVERVLDKLEIRDLSSQFLGRLSAGQKKRVFIARVFLRERDIYLLDEPTANLDPKMAKEIRGLILELSRDKVVLYSSHNLYEAREVGRHVLVIKDGRLTLFDRIENLRSSKFRLGVRLLDASASLPGWDREGEYFLRELTGPEDVPPILEELVRRGIKLREAREMDNPLERIFE